METNMYYEVLNDLGSGTFGKIFKVIFNGQIKAAKVFDLNGSGLNNITENVRCEINILKKLYHQGISNYVYDLFFIHNNLKYMTIIMDFFTGITIDEYIFVQLEKHQRYDVTRLCNMNDLQVVLEDLRKTLQYIHLNNIAHRDIKMENVMITNSGLKIIDFGLSIDFESRYEEYTTLKGSILYLSPELWRYFLKGTGSKRVSQELKQILLSSDIWALGIVMYNLLFGENPFEDEIAKAIPGDHVPIVEEYTKIVDSITTTLNDDKLLKTGNKAIDDLVSNMLQLDHTKRS